MAIDWKGVFPALTTKFDRDDQLDLPLFEKRDLAETGVLKTPTGEEVPRDSQLTKDLGIVCRWHDTCFDLQTGQPRNWVPKLQADGTSPGWEFLGDLSKHRAPMKPFHRPPHAKAAGGCPGQACRIARFATPQDTRRRRPSADRSAPDESIDQRVSSAGGARAGRRPTTIAADERSSGTATESVVAR